MLDNMVSFENSQIGATPEGWTATLIGKGDSIWTVESDETAPSNSKILTAGPLTPFTGAGKVGLWTKADSVTLFDQITYSETK